ncbi:hypothetical protein Aph02nite_14440 [Actinoplanes philippinensis]|uniref:Uncharacterized protein n=1 Tax=Actinoplanes philippinensis TaxID=35752 RepID=A0A1I1ZHM4_9ACTN|nr:hypothetical protein [Actinoplanes philippinensis]GIE75494.1 hypothetical protein Aph02nite_14440 [Actinoplanes philippinensis]SFE30838.1 hypothetical protein SAMN05421541_10193 [Actinoplanes philippinensis]
MRIRTDEDAEREDVTALLGAGRFADALVPAALQADRLGTHPRSLTFLAEIVRRGGCATAARLPEPLPGPDQTRLIRPWLLAAGEAPPPSPAGPSFAAADARLARWLDGVAALIDARPRRPTAG